MKKIAICLRGAVSRKNNSRMTDPGSLYSDEDYVDYKKCGQSIFDFIVNENKHHCFDFFCHSWNQDLHGSLEELYNPISIETEDNRQYEEEIINNLGVGDKFSLVSQALSTKKSIELKEQYEEESNFQYDVVILYRYDVLLWKKMKIDDYNLNDKDIYVNAHPGCGGDFHFLMTSDTSRVFKNLYGCGVLPYPHVWIQQFASNINKNLVMDKIVPGIDQEVIRKIS